jgi:uncharacterized protein
MKMPTSTARVATETPGRYLGQLCKHFEHKLPVAFTPTHGQISFDFGVCVLDAEAGTLVMRAEAEDAESLAKTQEVVARHLERFAFREPPQIVWEASAPSE